MASTSVYLITLGVWLLDTVYAGEYCRSRASTQYCDTGCCNEGSDPCCIALDVLNLVYIVVGVVGGLVLVCLVSTVICCYIYHSRRRQRPGIVVGQQQVMTLSTVQPHTVMYQPTLTDMYPQSPVVPGPIQQAPSYQSPPNVSPPGSTGNQTTEKRDPTI